MIKVGRLAAPKLQKTRIGPHLLPIQQGPPRVAARIARINFSDSVAVKRMFRMVFVRFIPSR